MVKANLLSEHLKCNMHSENLFANLIKLIDFIDFNYNNILMPWLEGNWRLITFACSDRADWSMNEKQVKTFQFIDASFRFYMFNCRRKLCSSVTKFVYWHWIELFRTVSQQNLLCFQVFAFLGKVTTLTAKSIKISIIDNCTHVLHCELCCELIKLLFIYSTFYLGNK